MENGILRKKLVWLSRRGLLELDLWLSKFITSPGFKTLNNEELSVYHSILQWEDQQLLCVLQGLRSITEPRQLNLITKIQASVGMGI
ncbi:MAG: succinate dehydrogenase assembly factor 2 [Neisseriaceae bacterium]